MKCTQINVGDMSHKIVIERSTRTPDGMGGVTVSWAADPAGGVWAALKNLTGTERWENDRSMPGNLIRCWIRWRADGDGQPYYTTEDRVLYRTHYYTILKVMDLEWKQQFIELDLQEGKPS